MDENRTNPANIQGRADHVSIISTTVAFALSHGMTLAEIEAETGLDHRSLGDPDARLNDEIPHHLWAMLAKTLPAGTAWTLEAARSASFSALGGLMHGAQYASTLRDALGFLGRNGRFLSDRLTVEMVETDEHLRMTATHPNDAIDQGRSIEVGSALITRLVREVLTANIAPSQVGFAYDPLGPESSYAVFFHCPVVFNAPAPFMAYAKADLDKPISSAQPTLFAVVEQHFAETIERIAKQSKNPTLHRLQTAIAETTASRDFSLAAVADRANLSPRSAQRVAAAHGTTVQAMILAERQSLAESLLADPTLRVDSIAVQTGFSDDRAFRRAFKQWTGHSPKDFRRLLVAAE
ncbi:MAG: helix-turn-helix domain-containing protein [Rhodospirillaceae bacterium]